MTARLDGTHGWKARRTNQTYDCTAHNHLHPLSEYAQRTGSKGARKTAPMRSACFLEHEWPRGHPLKIIGHKSQQENPHITERYVSAAIRRF